MNEGESARAVRWDALGARTIAEESVHLRNCVHELKTGGDYERIICPMLYTCQSIYYIGLVNLRV